MDRAGNIVGGRLLASIIPMMFGIVGAFVDNVPISVMGPWIPSPLFSLMPLYYWCLVRPDLMTPAWAFLIGATEDILSGGPPGIWGRHDGEAERLGCTMMDIPLMQEIGDYNGVDVKVMMEILWWLRENR